MKHPSSPTKGYDRLEFLGDSILKTIQSKYLFEANPEWGEGQLSKTRAQMENNEQLALWCRHLGLDSHIKCGRSIERGTPGWVNICSQVFEAFLGAIWIDCEFDFQEICGLYMSWELPVREIAIINYKSKLQESLQKAFSSADLSKLDCLPKYEEVHREGPPHQPVFVVTCSVITVEQGNCLDFDWDMDELVKDDVEEDKARDRIVRHETTGRGATKKKAETDAAYNMLIRLRDLQVEKEAAVDCSGYGQYEDTAEE
eukprot:CAMPEP_0114414220 /NCGR_PEP_ID=MMETSP0103-20121206/1271_1 /TAXON_ID=37642 ORGANISM="Paraphysomonas imperforata, Strain PA2" /NCGR_SAMPLE_ID=MMETSP0103 /ASSEMBLY_ACC=CAM_ASM_000201 /LENGTH=256 /DNA_ID=CAMNT_0001582345 /DNA_START=255 /DNA_END=1023 /DNA_ORIENTATION=-